MLENSLRYPVEGNAVRRYGIVTLLYALSIFLLPAFILSGYFARAAGNVAQGDESPPTFTDWAELLVLGLKTTLASFVYFILPLGLAILGLATSFQAISGAAGATPELGATSLLLFGGSGLLSLVVMYFFPAAVVAVAVEDRIGAAFEFSNLRPVWGSSDYLVAVALLIALSFVSSIVTQILGFTIIGLLFVPAVVFYFSLVGYYLVGEAYGGILDLRVQEV